MTLKQAITPIEEPTEKKCGCELDGFQGAVTSQNCPLHNIPPKDTCEGKPTTNMDELDKLEAPHSGDCVCKEVCMPKIMALKQEAKDICEHCNGKVSSYRNGCPGCGAPMCCKNCCDEASKSKDICDEWDCFDEECGECNVCKYLNFLDWADSVGKPEGTTIERNGGIESYLKKLKSFITQKEARAREEERAKILTALKGKDWVSVAELEDILSALALETN